MALMARGAEVRRVGETNMNRESSRSHAVFTATVEVATQEASGLTNVRYSRINLVDLAGEQKRSNFGYVHVTQHSLVQEQHGPDLE